MVEITGIAHAAIFTQHRRLVELSRETERSRELLDESVQIVFADAANATRKARSLAERWGEQQLLDPDAARDTAAHLAREVNEAEGRLAALLARQEKIAVELEEMAGGEREE